MQTGDRKRNWKEYGASNSFRCSFCSCSFFVLVIWTLSLRNIGDEFHILMPVIFGVVSIGSALFFVWDYRSFWVLELGVPIYQDRTAGGSTRSSLSIY